MPEMLDTCVNIGIIEDCDIKEPGLSIKNNRHFPELRSIDWRESVILSMSRQEKPDMPIVFRHKCGQRLALSIDMAGKTGRCPQCSERIVIPDRETLLKMVEQARAKHLQNKEKEEIGPVASESPRQEPAQPVTPAADIKRPVAPPPAPKAPKPSEVEPLKPEEAAAPAAKCPNCGNDVAADAVICVNCGTNLKTGKKLKTVSDEKSSEEKPKPEKLAESPPTNDEEEPRA